ncbi:MAG: hypothetical protein GY871_04225 [Actinomycetales bacterium]|nr:hypothetical protein [Actinomycetales bacterium]
MSQQDFGPVKKVRLSMELELEAGEDLYEAIRQKGWAYLMALLHERCFDGDRKFSATAIGDGDVVVSRETWSVAAVPFR